MRLCSIKDVEDGMILGQSIYDVDGKLLLKDGCSLSSSITSRIRKRGYNYLYIMEDGTEDIMPEDLISNQIRLQANLTLMEKTEEIRMVSKFQNMSLEKAEKLIEDGYFKKINITSGMKNIVKDIVKNISITGVKSLNTLMLKSHDSYFMDHAVNTTVLATLIAQKFKFTSKEITSLALGTFLHDIGKTIMEQFQYHDKSENAKEFYLKHPKFGYDLLRYSYDISPVETQIVYQHHEYQDGSGFPRELIGENFPPLKLKNRKTKGKIFRLAEICCVANAYDKMVLNPKSEKQMDPHDVLKQIIKDSGIKYNKSVVQALFQVIPEYQVGVYVRVIDSSDPSIVNYTGVVAEINENTPNKPKIIFLKDRLMKKINPMFIDMSELKFVKLKLVL